MKNFLNYLKELSKEWYVYISFIPWIIDFVSIYFPKYQFDIPTSYPSIFLVVVFIFANFKIWEKAKKNKTMPKIIIDYDLSVFNIIYLEIKNIGNDYAKNINITFEPNIKNINDKNFLKNIPLLEPILADRNKKIRFRFGSFLDKEFLQKFNIKITYFNLDEKIKFTETQMIDLSFFIGAAPIKQKNDKIVEELNNISKYLADSSNRKKEILEILKNGLIIRNLDVNSFSLEELKFLLKNIILNGNEEDLWLNPYIYDTKHIIQILRSRLLTYEELNKKDKEILEQLNVLHKYQFNLGNNNEFNQATEKVKQLLINQG